MSGISSPRLASTPPLSSAFVPDSRASPVPPATSNKSTGEEAYSIQSMSALIPDISLPINVGLDRESAGKSPAVVWSGAGPGAAGQPSGSYEKRVPGIFQKPQKLQFRAQIMAYRILTRYQPLPSKIALTAGVRAEVGAQEGVSEPGGQAGCVELGEQTAEDRDLE